MLFLFKRKPFRGIARAYAVPYSDEQEMLRYWQRLTRREQRKMLVYEHDNLITTNGLTNINGYYTSLTTVAGFALWYAVGTGAINGVAVGDTSLASEVYRLQPTSHSVAGNVITLITYFSGTQGGHSGTNPVTYTNAGLYGGSATSTPNSGTLNTHVPYAFPKQYGQAINNTYVVDRS